MKILFVLENYFPHIGGVETLFDNLARELSKNDHEVVVLTTLKNSSDKAFEKIGNITIHRKSYGNRYLFTILAFFSAFKLSKNCDLIHTTSYNAALPAWLAGRCRNKKVVITFHEVWGELWFKLPFMSKFGARLHYMFEQMLLELSFHKFVAVSKYTQQALIAEGVSADNIEMIYNGIDYKEFDSIMHTPSKTDFTFTFFGRLGMSKGIELYLEAISLMSNLRSDVKFQLIIPTQPKPFLDDINALIDQLDIRKRIQIKHNLTFTQLQNTIAGSNAIVIPSHSEGFCFAAVETMAIGTPIISSAKGALKEVVSGKHLTMQTFDSAGLKKCMDLAISGEWNFIPNRKFLLSDTVNKYISLYRESLT